MAWRDDVLLKRSTRRGLGSFLLGLFVILTLLVAFFSLKKPLLRHIQEKIDHVYASQEKVKPAVKRVKAKKISNSKQEYGFYTILPSREIRSPHN